MSYYLRHYFDPHFNHLSLKPKVSADGRADRYNLGYVQNVIRGQILAEMIPSDQENEPELEFFRSEPELPAGFNTAVNPDYPQYLLADANGYAFYLDGKVTVKNVLNARGNVDFHTGNIFFVGNLAVHGDVKAGFEVQANDILIKGLLEGGIARAQHDMVIQGGVRGHANGKCLVDAGKSLRISHVENAEVRSHGKLLIEKFCLHSRLYVTGNVMVQGRLYGGSCQANGTVYVSESLGNASGTPTEILLGYDPFRIRQLERVETHLAELAQRVMHYAAVAGHLPPDANELSRRLAAARYKQKRLQGHRQELWNGLSMDEGRAAACRVLVPGTVHPGVSIAIGRAVFTVSTPMHNVMFCLEDNAVKVQPMPAPQPKKRS